jgi:hypothetical protein
VRLDFKPLTGSIRYQSPPPESVGPRNKETFRIVERFYVPTSRLQRATDATSRRVVVRGSVRFGLGTVTQISRSGPTSMGPWSRFGNHGRVHAVDDHDQVGHAALSSATPERRSARVSLTERTGVKWKGASAAAFSASIIRHAPR